MTDPIIAELDLSNVYVPVYLSDAPKVDDLFNAAKVMVQVGSFDIATEELAKTIRAIEPEWSP